MTVRFIMICFLGFHVCVDRGSNYLICECVWGCYGNLQCCFRMVSLSELITAIEYETQTCEYEMEGFEFTLFFIGFSVMLTIDNDIIIMESLVLFIVSIHDQCIG